MRALSTVRDVAYPRFEFWSELEQFAGSVACWKAWSRCAAARPDFSATSRILDEDMLWMHVERRRSAEVQQL